MSRHLLARQPNFGLAITPSELTAASTPDQVHACQMMTKVHTVSIVAKNKYSGRAGIRAPTRGGTKVRKPFTRVKMAPAMIFASRFALNGSSRDARIMAMGISIKTAEPIRAHGGRWGRRLDLASQQYQTGQQRLHTGSSITRRSRIETTAPCVMHVNLLRKVNARSQLYSRSGQRGLLPV